jgi:DNA-binding response OmpR family regulator
MTMDTVLVVEDSRAMQRTLQRLFESDSLQVQIAPDGLTGLELFRKQTPSAVILDLKLPGKSGKELCREFKALAASVPIVVLSANSEIEDKVLLLELGADDYVTKPFSLRELTARVRAVLRRGPAAEQRQGRYQGARLIADFEAVAIAVDGAPVRLTRREFELLQYLVQNKNRVVSRDRLLERVWGYERLVETRSVDVHVGRLRNKLRTAGHQIETVVGLGYRFVD